MHNVIPQMRRVVCRIGARESGDEQVGQARSGDHRSLPQETNMAPTGTEPLPGRLCNDAGRYGSSPAHETTFAGALRVVHRLVRLGKQPIHQFRLVLIVATTVQVGRYPDAHTDGHTVITLEGNWPLDRGKYTLGAALGIGGRDDYDELVAPKTSDDVGPANRAGEPRSDDSQNLITSVVSMQVVHDLEAVKVAEQHADRHATADHSSSDSRSPRRFSNPVRVS